jgi:ATP-dependent RNA helicase HelY
VLATGLTPGDFVRAAKQLIDLLDQVAAAASSAAAADRAAGNGEAGERAAGEAAAGVAAAGVAATARKAVSALRRGIVAYSSVG